MVKMMYVCECVCVLDTRGGEGGDSPWLMLPLTQPHADSLLNLNAGQSSVTHLVSDCQTGRQKTEFKKIYILSLTVFIKS